jgi:signal transduction histidine kinase
MPIVTPSFIMTILGFRSSAKSVIIGMSAGFITVLIISLNFESVNSIAPGFFMNIFFLFGSHYILKQPGGWVEIAKKASFLKSIEQKKIKRKEFFRKIMNFKFLEFINKNKPTNNSNFTLAGIFILIATFSSMYSMPTEIRTNYTSIIEIIYHTVLFVAAIFLIYPVLPSNSKINIVAPFVWIFGLFYTLIFINYLLLIISEFKEFQLMIFLLSAVVLSILMQWQLALSLIIIGVFSSIKFYEWFIDASLYVETFGTLQFKVMYMSLLVSSVLLAFIKPKQEQQKASDIKVDTLETEVTHLDDEVTHLTTEVTDLNEKVDHYSERVSDQDKEIDRLGATAQKILNNVNHELRLPVGNVMNFAQMLNEGLGKFNESQLKMLSDEVYQNSNRLSSMIMNMLDLAALNAKKLELDKKTINLGELVKDRVDNCRKIYLEGKKIDFKLDIQPEIIISVDPNYIRQVVDNLVINAIKFSSEGVIKIKLIKQKNHVEFVISDNGIGIPQQDTYDIFTPFKMGSNTDSKAEGRGVGLALCRAAIEAHGGIIKAESKGQQGTTFKFVLGV